MRDEFLKVNNNGVLGWNDVICRRMLRGLISVVGVCCEPVSQSCQVNGDKCSAVKCVCLSHDWPAYKSNARQCCLPSSSIHIVAVVAATHCTCVATSTQSPLCRCGCCQAMSYSTAQKTHLTVGRVDPLMKHQSLEMH